jgi:high-affinity K+ transport system ATPase subunit B
MPWEKSRLWHTVSLPVMMPTDILARNLFTYGLGGILQPFLGIKLIDMLITTLGLA